ncbi:MAG: hypothetical protein M3430_10310 [Acidobacteriota bacterium]|nr:hypothetical protein [Acidobacteriota bacterium]
MVILAVCLTGTVAAYHLGNFPINHFTRLEVDNTRPRYVASIKLMGITESGPQFGTPGYEVNFLYLAGLRTLVLGGAGPLSIDGTPAHRKRAPGGLSRRSGQRCIP